MSNSEKPNALNKIPKLINKSLLCLYDINPISNLEKVLLINCIDLKIESVYKEIP